jgi:poly-gamma-glutamate synthesis protein (capsule biosynthesis protein)
MKKMGFDLLSHANNHDTDWGIKGMEATDRALDKAGIVHAGTGKNSALARAPAYLTTPQGRIALVAMTSSFTPLEPAGAAMRGILGRPGVNTLRTTAYHVVTAQQMGWLRKIYNAKPHKPVHPAGPATKQLNLFRIHYEVGPADSVSYTMNSYDLDQILRTVREGKEQSNFEIVYIHDHQPGNWSDRSANFVPVLAHDAIDAGADEFVASGPHQLRGIEIYKGKPIFYGLGNFAFMIGQLEFLSPRWMQRSGFNVGTATDHELENYRRVHEGFGAPIWYRSVVAVSEFDSSGRVREIKLYPIELGYKRVPDKDVGVPRIASGEVAHTILVNLQSLSKPYGTHIIIRNNVGIIRVGARK